MRVGLLIPMMALAACTTAGPKPVDVAEQPVPELRDQCRLDQVADLVGKTWAESMRAAVLKRAAAGTLRVNAPGMAVTMDYRSDRLNIATDTKGRIVRVTCG
ncbi:I78 family peptidase inhibitor [Sphingomonadaceae bacterium jetA1]|jgi:hypothetical protein|uniref:I78 family peptidase inhibitor n=1 Tax=Facivitalis istanbulensis TaxID=3075838 RepID=UPI00348EF054